MELITRYSISICLILLLSCVRYGESKAALCISETYAGQCKDDDQACAQSCSEENLKGGKCDAFRSMRVCYCEGCSRATTGNGGITVVNRNCSVEGQVIGLSQLSTDQCGSVECECFKGVYFCYSTCFPPPTGQSCTPTVPTAGRNVCPTYSDCNPQAKTTSGPSEIFRCNGAVHPSVCWLHEIVYGHLTEPLGFFESVAQGCPLTSQCVCGTNGFVQPAQLRQEDFKTPANNLVYLRTTPGAKGAFATRRR